MILPKDKKYFYLLLLLAAGAMCRNCLAQEKQDDSTEKHATQLSTSPGEKQEPQGQPLESQVQNSSPAAPGPQGPPQRILDAVIPYFQTTNQRPAYTPLTTREKYMLAYHGAFNISVQVCNAFQAGFQQASNGQPHYGQGWGAYAQRFEAAEADQVTSSFFIFGFLPHVLKEDPRYFRKGRGSLWSRLGYAVSRTVITRKDSGADTFNTPQVLGQLLQQSISTAYYPQQDRSAKGVFLNWGISLAYNSGYNALKEYYPDFLHWFFHRRAKPEAHNAALGNAPPGQSQSF